MIIIEKTIHAILMHNANIIKISITLDLGGGETGALGWLLKLMKE